MSVLKGDFIGFTYNGKHSSELGIIRTSDGSRFNQGLLPTLQDKVVPVPGRDGSYYFGSQYNQKNFNVPFAFDSLTEKQLKQLSRHFGDKKIHELIFDEAPYKKYEAKVTGTAMIKYICFTDRKSSQRVYKGEGNIQFTAYFPYAKSVHKFLNEYTNDNKEEWAEASGLLMSGQDTYDIFKGSDVLLYNPGDIETDWQLALAATQANPITIKLLENGREIEGSALTLEPFNAKGEDTQVKIDSKNNLIEGYKNINTSESPFLVRTGNIYNESLLEGNFFKIPITNFDIDGQPIELTFRVIGADGEKKIDYNYLYY